MPALRPETFSRSFPKDHRAQTRKTETIKYMGGYSVKLAAEELGVSPNTVRTHVRSLYNKMDIHNRDDLVRFCRLYAKIDEKRRD